MPKALGVEYLLALETIDQRLDLLRLDAGGKKRAGRLRADRVNK